MPDNHPAHPATSVSELPDPAKKTWRQRVKAVVWDSLDRSPEERRFIAKIDFFILTWAGFTYFSKNLNTNNVCEYDTSVYLQCVCPANLHGSQCLCVRDEGGAQCGGKSVPDFYYHVDNVSAGTGDRHVSEADDAHVQRLRDIAGSVADYLHPG